MYVCVRKKETVQSSQASQPQGTEREKERERERRDLIFSHIFAVNTECNTIIPDRLSSFSSPCRLFTGSVYGRPGTSYRMTHPIQIHPSDSGWRKAASKEVILLRSLWLPFKTRSSLETNKRRSVRPSVRPTVCGGDDLLFLFFLLCGVLTR